MLSSRYRRPRIDAAVEWGFAVALGPVIRRRFRGTASEAELRAQADANAINEAVDYWDEADQSFEDGKAARSLKTVEPIRIRH